MDDLLPLEEIRLLAVCVRHPHNLAQQIALTPLWPGVYEVREMALRIRVIVVHQLPLQEHNAMLHLFSAREELLRYGRDHYRPHGRDTSTLLLKLLRAYREETDMSDSSRKLQEFVRQTIDEMLSSLSLEERLKGVPMEERLKGLSAEEVLHGLSPETLEALARQLKTNGRSAKPNGSE